jgi:biopolymer transport protein ExbD
MKTFRRQPVSVNTGSMADIAFLLLIFFLVSTTISAEKGILRQLPPYCEDPKTCELDIKDRNLLEISLNYKDEILISNSSVKLNDVPKIVKSFIDNNGLSQCDYCQGKQLPEYSEHPKKAVIFLNFDSLTSYKAYIEVQDQIAKAYNTIRQAYAINRFNKSLGQLDKAEMQVITQNYPIRVYEVNANTSQ